MDAITYKNKFKKLLKLRGEEPKEWWCSANHKDNLKSYFLCAVMESTPEHYKRELKFQKGLAKIKKARLEHALPYKSGDKVKIRNYNYIPSRKNGSKIIVEIINKADQISCNGDIIFYVKYEYKKGECMVSILRENGYKKEDVTQTTFQIYQEQIL